MKLTILIFTISVGLFASCRETAKHEKNSLNFNSTKRQIQSLKSAVDTGNAFTTLGFIKSEKIQVSDKLKSL